MSNSSPTQLSLNVLLQDEATFANYIAGQKDALLVRALKEASHLKGEKNIVIWSESEKGSGLSHLMQACCHSAHQNSYTAQYLPLPEIKSYDPAGIFEGLDELNVVCLDGLETVVGSLEWETSLFNLFNGLRERGGALLVAMHGSPSAVSFTLPDFRSRILGSVIYRLQGLNDEEKCQALIVLASRRGLEMSDDVARYICVRSSRNFSHLHGHLINLDKASLQQQRKLTIPFVKQVLGW